MYKIILTELISVVSFVEVVLAFADILNSLNKKK